jgi:hypothetical protein
LREFMAPWNALHLTVGFCFGNSKMALFLSTFEEKGNGGRRVEKEKEEEVRKESGEEGEEEWVVVRRGKSFDEEKIVRGEGMDGRRGMGWRK